MIRRPNTINGVAESGQRYGAISRSQRADWYVAVTVPSRRNAILYRSLAMVGGGGFGSSDSASL
jgi:hypothetical protein